MATGDFQLSHDWVRRRLAAWRAGLLEEDEAARVSTHLAGCADCRALADAYASEGAGDGGAHVAASLLADWPSARTRLRGLERALVRRHLERCAACRQDLEAIGFEPALEWVPALEANVELGAAATTPAAGPVAAGAPDGPIPPAARETAPHATSPPAASAGPHAASRPAPPVPRVVRFERAAARHAWRDRALVTWASVASAAAVLLLFVDLRGKTPALGPGAPLWTTPVATEGPFSGLSLRLAPKPRSLKGPARGEGVGKLNVIPVVGPLSTLALGIKPLDVPDTSLVTLSLLNASGDTLYAMRYRQWELRPNQMLLIDRPDATLAPGLYALVLASEFAKAGDAIEKISRYRFELRER